MRKAICMRCNQPTWVNIITVNGAVHGEVCADCFDDVDHDDDGRARGQIAPARPCGVNPGHDNSFDNTVRAYEGMYE